MCLFIFIAQIWLSISKLQGHKQLLVVTTQSWNEKKGELVAYERIDSSSPWTSTQAPIPVVIGENGMAWGVGLHKIDHQNPFKQEGDKKSPAGMFSLGSAFGFAFSAELKIEYFSLHPFIEAVDDPLSVYYNCIIDRRQLIPDWQSSEKMNEEPLYEIGLVINHNFPNPQPYAGSAIFFHIWENEDVGTAGCTAMSLENLRALLCWLDPSKHPLLVQLPIEEYKALQENWNLPIR